MKDASRPCSPGGAQNSIVSLDARRQMKALWIRYAAFSWYTLFNANADATFRREEKLDDTERGRVVPRRVLLTNLHLARRQMSLCNQNYLSIQEPLPRFCVFRLSLCPLASSLLGLFSFFIQIPSRGIIKRETLVPREKERENRVDP